MVLYILKKDMLNMSFLNGITTFITNLFSIIFNVVKSLLDIFLKNEYVFENEPGSYIGYLIVMFIVFCIIIYILFRIFRFITENLEEYIGTGLSASLSISFLIEVLGWIFNVVTFGFSIIAEFVTLTVMFFIIYLILRKFFSGEPEPRRRR